MARKRLSPSKVHGSVYPGPAKEQDSKYAARVAESQAKAKKRAEKSE